VEAILDAILRHLERLDRSQLLARLQPGIPSADVRHALSRLGLAGSDDLLGLYEWHNGTRVPEGTALDDVHFFPGFYFLALDDATTNFLAFRDDGRWSSTWLPIFSNGGGDFYAVDCGTHSETLGAVIGFMVDQIEQPVEYESLRSMMATLADCFEQGVFFVDRRGYLEMDYARHAEIARRHNPRLPIWSGS
jgi:cell wall assembly regulator SMI1